MQRGLQSDHRNILPFAPEHLGIHN